MSDDRKRAVWYVLALVVLFIHNVYVQHRMELAQADAIIDAAEIKALVRWVAWLGGSQ